MTSSPEPVQQLAGLRESLAALRTETRELEMSRDGILADLDRRIAALEEVAATRWPARIRAAARIGRSLREQVRHWPDAGTWVDRRIRQAANDLQARAVSRAADQPGTSGR